jgi:hypothetical protein
VTHRNVGILIWAALIILLLIGLLFPPIPNRISTELGAAGWLSGSLFSLGALSAGVFSLGIFSFGTFAAGVWVAGQFVARRLPWLHLGLLLIGLLYSLVRIYFIPQMLAVLGVLPSTQPVPIHLLLITFGALVACLAYLLGLAVNWKRL